MTLTDIQEQRKVAMKNKDAETKTILTLLLDRIQKQAKAEKREAENRDIVVAAKKEMKQLEEEFTTKVIAEDQYLKRAAILEKFLPTQISEDEVLSIIKETKESIKDPNMGAMMKALKEKIGDNFDSKRLSELVKASL